MKISIVIPVYNGEKYLRECIESSLNQTYKDIEIIAVNDGSTDRSLEILNEYSDKIKIITKENGGTASALNAGIAIMQGEWFKWLSADDVLYPNAIEELVIVGDKIKDKTKNILYSHYDIIDHDGKIVREMIEPDYSSLSQFDFNIMLLDHFIGNGSSSLIHKSIIEKFGGFNEELGFKEDYELWLRDCIEHNCRLHLVPKKLIKYRVHQTQLSKKNYVDSLEKTNTIKKIVLDRLSQQQKEKYEIALKEYQKRKPIMKKGRNIIRDIMLKLLPKSTSNKIISEYMNRKN